MHTFDGQIAVERIGDLTDFLERYNLGIEPMHPKAWSKKSLFHRPEMSNRQLLLGQRLHQSISIEISAVINRKDQHNVVAIEKGFHEFKGVLRSGCPKTFFLGDLSVIR